MDKVFSDICNSTLCRVIGEGDKLQWTDKEGRRKERYYMWRTLCFQEKETDVAGGDLGLIKVVISYFSCGKYLAFRPRRRKQCTERGGESRERGKAGGQEEKWDSRIGGGWHWAQKCSEEEASMAVIQEHETLGLQNPSWGRQNNGPQRCPLTLQLELVDILS